GANAGPQDLTRRAGGGAREAIDQVRVQLPCRDHSGATGGDAKKVGDAVIVEGQEGVEDGRHEDTPPRVRLVRRRKRQWIRLPTLPCALGIELAGRVAQRMPAARGLSELLRQLGEEVVGFEVPSRSRNLVTDNFGIGEVL